MKSVSEDYGPTLQTSSDDSFAVFTHAHERDHGVSLSNPPDSLEAQRGDEEVCRQLREVCERHRGLMRGSARVGGGVSGLSDHDDCAVAHRIFIESWDGIELPHDVLRTRDELRAKRAEW